MIAWIRAPRWLYTPCYIALGWVAVFNLPEFAHADGTAVVVLVVTGGLLHTAGAVGYGLKRPYPSPAWFGFPRGLPRPDRRRLHRALHRHPPRSDLTVLSIRQQSGPVVKCDLPGYRGRNRSSSLSGRSP